MFYTNNGRNSALLHCVNLLYGENNGLIIWEEIETARCDWMLAAGRVAQVHSYILWQMNISAFSLGYLFLHFDYIEIFVLKCYANYCLKIGYEYVKRGITNLWLVAIKVIVFSGLNRCFLFFPEN